jgi:S-adenosylmethionine decarboxylase
MPEPLKKLKLHGFNNLTKTLSLNIYDVCYADTGDQQRAYIAYIDEAYNAQRLTHILSEVARIIGANILHVSRQDYEPQGASVTLLISEEPLASQFLSSTQAPGLLRDTLLAHLDKSHIAVHTYPESHPRSGISTFRADIDVSTCGLISPLKALNYLLHALEADIVTMDYRVRGFTRDVRGHKHFIDHNINSIQNYLPADIKRRYQMTDVNVYQENFFHTKLMVKDFCLEKHLFCVSEQALQERQRKSLSRLLRREMAEIFYGRNLTRNLDL